jgi:hypothetical protein
VRADPYTISVEERQDYVGRCPEAEKKPRQVGDPVRTVQLCTQTALPLAVKTYHHSVSLQMEGGCQTVLVTKIIGREDPAADVTVLRCLM